MRANGKDFANFKMYLNVKKEKNKSERVVYSVAFKITHLFFETNPFHEASA